MEKIDKANMPALLPVKRGRDTHLRVGLLSLQVGDGLFLPKAEWKRKSSPAFVVSRLKKTHGLRFEYGRKADGSGWLFRRVT